MTLGNTSFKSYVYRRLDEQYEWHAESWTVVSTGGAPHATINLDDTIAVSTNFLDPVRGIR